MANSRETKTIRTVHNPEKSSNDAFADEVLVDELVDAEIIKIDPDSKVITETREPKKGSLEEATLRLNNMVYDEVLNLDKQKQEQKRKELEKKDSYKKLKDQIVGINDPITPFGKSKIGYLTGIAAGVGLRSTPFRLVGSVVFITTNMLWEKYARSKVNSSKTPEIYAKRVEKYQRSKKFIRGLTAGMTATSLVSVFRPEWIEALTESKPFTMSESWLKWKWSEALGHPPSEFGLDEFGRQVGGNPVVNQPQTIELGNVPGSSEMASLDGMPHPGTFGTAIELQPGDTIEELINETTGMSDAQLYNSKSYMEGFFQANEHIFMQTNHEAAQAFNDLLYSGKEVSIDEFRSAWLSAVRNAWPGQTIIIPQPSWQG